MLNTNIQREFVIKRRMLKLFYVFEYKEANLVENAWFRENSIEGLFVGPIDTRVSICCSDLRSSDRKTFNSE